MNQDKDSEIADFRSLLAMIRTEIDDLKKWITSKNLEEEGKKALSLFNDAIQTQVFGTLDHLKIYQLYGWRELAVGGDNASGTLSTKKQ